MAAAMSIESMYMRKERGEDDARPEDGMASLVAVKEELWTYNVEDRCMEFRALEFVPALLQIYDAVLVNAAENNERDTRKTAMTRISITVDTASGVISIRNNGSGIPVVKHRTEDVLVPTMVFGTWSTSSHFGDTHHMAASGRGNGAKLCNIFSKRFQVETASTKYGNCRFEQVWEDNMRRCSDPILAKHTKGESYEFTKVTFTPDLARFGVDSLNADTVSLMAKRAAEVAGCLKGVACYFNGKKIPVDNFKDYVELYQPHRSTVAFYQGVCSKWDVAVAVSDGVHQQMSFVNAVATLRGGKHVDHVRVQIVNHLLSVLRGKDNWSVDAQQIVDHMWLFVRSSIVNPVFDNQQKDHMTTDQRDFGSVCKLSKRFLDDVANCGLLEILEALPRDQDVQDEQDVQDGQDVQDVRAEHQDVPDCDSGANTSSRILDIPHLQDANRAGTRSDSKACTLILIKDDSALDFAMVALGRGGHDKYGLFSLRNTFLNVRGDSLRKQIQDNAEIRSLMRILGLKGNKKYASLDGLRYGKVMLMMDRNEAGTHLKAHLINFFHHNWPELLRSKNYLLEFFIPIVRAWSSNERSWTSFYTISQYEEWKQTRPDDHVLPKYYDVLDAITKDERFNFANIERYHVSITYNGPEDDNAIDMAFSKETSVEWKEWAMNLMDREATVERQKYVYRQGVTYISIRDFINVVYVNMAIKRNFPSIVDGLTPLERSILNRCFDQSDNEIEVTRLATSVGDGVKPQTGSLDEISDAIIHLTHDHAGSNQINLLLPIGHYGSRLWKRQRNLPPAKTKLSPLARLIYQPLDDSLVRHQDIEPIRYASILPMVLVNGITTATPWESHIPCFKVTEVIANLLRMIDGIPPLPMTPRYRGYRGEMRPLSDNSFLSCGCASILPNNYEVEVTELPVGVSVATYKEKVLKRLLQASGTSPAAIIKYDEYHTGAITRFHIGFTREGFRTMESIGFHCGLELTSRISLENMWVLDHEGRLHCYGNPIDVLEEFFAAREELFGTGGGDAWREQLDAVKREIREDELDQHPIFARPLIAMPERSLPRVEERLEGAAGEAEAYPIAGGSRESWESSSPLRRQPQREAKRARPDYRETFTSNDSDSE